MQREHVGSFRVLRLLAVGGMGEIFLAEREGPGGFSKQVVLKRLIPHLAGDPALLEQFFNEARIAALIAHPNVVQVFDLLEDHGEYFLVMEHVEGISLRTLTRALLQSGERLPPPLATFICLSVLRGLHHAHQLVHRGERLNVVHRDISPENVLIGRDGQVKLTDFGIAKARAARLTTEPGTFKGKLSYLPPEQLHGAPADPRMDLYSVGVVLFELLAGSRPFRAETEGELLHRILTEAPVMPAALAGEPAARVALKALAKNPAERYSSAEEMARALEETLRDAPPDPSDLAKRVERLSREASPPAAGTSFLRGTAKLNLQEQEPPGPECNSPPTAPDRLGGAILPAQGAATAGGAPPAEIDDSALSTRTCAGPAPRSRRASSLGAATGIAVALVVAAASAAGVSTWRSAVLTQASEAAEGASAAPAQDSADDARGAGRAARLADGSAADSVAEMDRSAGVAGAIGGAHADPDAVRPPKGGLDSAKAAAGASAGLGQPAEATRADADPAASDGGGAHGSAGAERPTPDTGAASSLEPRRASDSREAPKLRARPLAEQARRGRLQVLARPWAEVFLDGRRIGVTPMPEAMSVPAGTHVAQFRNSDLGVTKTVQVTVRAGKLSTVRVDLREP